MRISDWSSDVCSSDLESMQRLRVRPAGSHGGGDGAGNLRVRGQDRLDLAQLDPVPLDLHLEVLTPEELDRCRRVGRRAGVGPESAEIARAVTAFAGRRVGPEALGRALRIAPIAPGPALSGDPQVRRASR